MFFSRSGKFIILLDLNIKQTKYMFFIVSRTSNKSMSILNIEKSVPNFDLPMADRVKQMKEPSKEAANFKSKVSPIFDLMMF